MKRILLGIFIITSIVGCGCDTTTKHIHESMGSPYEVFIVAPQELFRGAIGDSLKTVLRENVRMINFDEPSYDLINILPSSYTGINMRHRNMIMLYLDPKYEKAEYFTLRDEKAKPQFVTVLRAPDSTSMMNLVMEHRYTIKDNLNIEEISRFRNRAIKMRDTKINMVIDSMFNITTHIPKGYKIRNIIKPDFAWISLETSLTSQGVVIYDYPFIGTSLPDSTIISMRNKFVAQIPGALPGGYMTTGYTILSETTKEVINSREWYVTRGFWRIENDFMGGPYILYSTIDSKNSRVVSLDCYVYSPDTQKDQRNLMAQLIGITEGTIIR